MTTYIFNNENKRISQSRNLRGLFEWARRAGGVKALHCHVYPNTDASYPLSPDDPRDKWIKATRPTGFLCADLANGYRAVTWFSCGSHLLDWAHDRAKPSRVSWFAGATIDVIRHDEWRDELAVYMGSTCGR